MVVVMVVVVVVVVEGLGGGDIIVRIKFLPFILVVQ